MLRISALVLFAAAALNLLLHTGHPFKAVLYANAAFLLAVAATPIGKRAAGAGEQTPEPLDRAFWLGATALAAAIYGISFHINLEFPDWTHPHITVGSVASFFTARQYDGFYRPLGFLSLWLDRRVFGEALWGYHLQNIVLQVLNAAILARLGMRLGLAPAAARFSGLLFVALPAGFEAVIWPGARFDLLATAFTLLAAERMLAGSLWAGTAAYAAGVLSKESAYCYPLLLAALLLCGRLDRRRARGAILAACAATVLLIGVRVAVYGNLGGYPSGLPGQSVNFQINSKTFTSLVTRLPAALYVLNGESGAQGWTAAALAAYVAALGAALLGGAALGRGAAFLLCAVLAAVPVANMIGWMTPAAQQSRYVYLPGAWVVLAIAPGILAARRGRAAAAGMLGAMSAAALLNSAAYVRMISAADVCAARVAGRCRAAPCCTTVSLRGVPGTLYGAFYFRDRVLREARRRLPGTAVEDSRAAAPCTAVIDWSEIKPPTQSR